ncbi:hypothetical protein C5B42_01635 [Candidatus Cerribacteria bacterium 'Amazon FNV 2010 28 9']|uniref:Uncharacterized protein n=1 Tax=Candidatus Cerribacteria bacterium 'Amazon FNV 2010 28 9' TaxID=2081795 RepID=A0A317JQX8_9BACT|nr:MAG: hypothetical protein C5B42_01635 [Candidatus Cerribacteria bacterium 'Amazon FNV 2010 28 9']
MKLLVTHHSPDLDAIGSCWMLKRFDAETYADAKIDFVNPGETIDLRTAADLGFAREDITHVDTGLGPFDHHQPERGLQRVCATTLAYDYVCTLHPELAKDEALFFLADYVNTIDHFEEVFWDKADDMKYQLLLQNLIEGVRLSGASDDLAQLNFGFTCLDSAYAVLTQQVEAYHELEQKGRPFKSPWGKALAIESKNDETIKLAQKQGFIVVVRKNAEHGNVRIKAIPGKQIDLTPLYEQIKREDTIGTWYFHPSKTMLLNGSSKSKVDVPSPLSLDRIVDMIKDLNKE